MTRITGNSLIATPCCRSIYSTPKYGSVNFSASAYWTDGYKEGALMPSGGGLRKCKCGEFYLLADAIAMGLAADSDTPPAQFILAADLPDAAQSRSKSIELAARREYWRYLNHDYRDLYRAHREEEDKASQAMWESEWHIANPDARSWSRKLIDRISFIKPAAPPQMPNKPFSVPLYQPTQLQRENMVRLLDLLLEGGNQKFDADPLELAELYRQLDQSNEVMNVLQAYTEEGATYKAIGQMLDAGFTAPVRYRV